MRTSSTLAAAAALAAAAPAAAQEPSYTPGSVWELTQLKIEPGQFDAYLDYLATNWKKIQDFGKKQGEIVSYHVLSVNNTRKDDPDLILAVEYKDYNSVAEREALHKKVEAFLRTTSRDMETASAGRTKMRTTLGSMELQELKLK